MNNDINIEEIMQEIRQNIKDRGYDKEPVSFEEIAMPKATFEDVGTYCEAEFVNEMEYISQNCSMSFHVPVNGRNPVALLFKKTIRKLTRFIVAPLVEFQNAYNVSNAKCMRQMHAYMAELETYKDRIEQLETELEQMKKKL